MKRIGLIVNPVAGIGGKVGLKGSDGAEIQRQAKELGATSQSPARTVEALKRFTGQGEFTLFTYPGDMGENEAIEAGIKPTVLGQITDETGPEDTRKAATLLREAGVDLLIFAGGDGTARDIYEAIDSTVPVLGIPTGVKIHSGVYAVSPMAAGDLVTRFLTDDSIEFRDTEVMDIDEEAFRDNVVSARLYGYMPALYAREFMQGSKEGSVGSDEFTLETIAAEVVEVMNPNDLYIIGPGTSTKPIAEKLGVEKTLLGVDVIQGGILLSSDANESTLLKLIQGKEANIIVTVIGGQGFVFGRGNQQISPQVIRQVGRENIIIVATPGKLATLKGKPLRVDTGDPTLDDELKGFYKVVTGYGRRTMYKIA
ncbi:MAG: ATP-NAD kinase family protein [Candidatus Bathyarchaeota archaeon]|nr:ATP-NAD kinase family protein [Candidatus Bathyarchaeota archaeon]